MNDPKIPDNSLTDHIRTIIKLTEDMEEEAFEFAAPISEEEIASWEKENGIKNT